MTRPATYADLPAICAMMAALHLASPYRDYPLSIERKFKPMAMGLMQSGNGCVFVNDTGFFMGSAEPLCQIYNVKFATDVFVWPGESGDALVSAFIAWSRTVPGVVRIRVSATNAEDLYESAGLSREGAIYTMEVSDVAL